jgi:acyl-CoA synthetase (AMP-forming)/AMP-acid ligase II
VTSAVYPAEVERVISSHPGVREVAVVGSPDRRLGEVLRAVVVPVDPAAPPSTDELRSHTREVLPGFKVPELWEFADELPRNASGKVLRRLVAEG